MKVILQKSDVKPFTVTVPGKWILAGEHAVLRGSEALVFPLHSKFLQLNFTPSDHELQLQIIGENRQDLELIIWSVLEKAFNLLSVRRNQIFGKLEIDSHIALGGGMGASATLCVALTEWLHHLGFVAAEQRFEFARNLENLFHGESSGVDVAVTLAKTPLVFTRNNGFTDLEIKSLPNLYLSYSGERGVTRDCVAKVKAMFFNQTELAKHIDAEMSESVKIFKQLLQQNVSLIDWIKTIKKSNHCFEQWGLVTDSVLKHEKVLLDAGALAVKLTGSGGGGYVLSLWEGSPPKDMPFEMIACFNKDLA